MELNTVEWLVDLQLDSLNAGNFHEFKDFPELGHVLISVSEQLGTLGPNAALTPAMVHAFVSSNFHLAETTASKITGFFCRPQIDEDFFVNAFSSDWWPLTDNFDQSEIFERYVNLLKYVLDSPKWNNEGWPHGRFVLTALDHNAGFKATSNLVHSMNLEFIQGNKLLNSLKKSRVQQHFTEFAELLTGFADKFGDPIWETWFEGLQEFLFQNEQKNLNSAMNRDVTRIFDQYFTRHLDVSEGGHVREASSLARLISEHVSQESHFWTLLESSITDAIPDWAVPCSPTTQRLAGLITAAQQGNSFARWFVSLGQHDDLIDFTWESWEIALGLDSKQVESAAIELVNVAFTHAPEGGRPAMQFNT